MNHKHSGSERRRSKRARNSDLRPEATVTFDAKGNPVMDVWIETPRRRATDESIDILECLVPNSLSIAEEQPDEEISYDPYRRIKR